MKPELSLKLNELRQGLNDVPTLLQPTLQDLNPDSYEISPIEPLHNIKEHLGKMIVDAIAVSKGEASKRLTSIKSTVLSKDTIRCSDYRKAVITIYMALEQVERLHYWQKCFEQQSKLRVRYTREKKYFVYTMQHLHIVCYAENFLTILSKSPGRKVWTILPCHHISFSTYTQAHFTESLYTELQEHMFNELKSITGSTSNHNTNQIITNILVRIQEEDKNNSNKSLSFFKERIIR